MDPMLLQSLVFWKPFRYVILFLGMVVEGEAMLLAASFLTQQGFFDPVEAAVVAFSGVIAGDAGWYIVGVHLDKLFPKRNKWIERVTRPLNNHLLAYPFRTILISKFAYGFHHITLLNAGMLKVRLKSIAKADFLASIVWIAVIGGIGYGASASIILLQRYVRIAAVALLAVLFLLILGGLYGVGHQIKKILWL